MQNATARLLTKTNKTEHITPVSGALHLLPSALKIDVKTLHIESLSWPGEYILKLLFPHQPVHRFRSRGRNYNSHSCLSVVFCGCFDRTWPSPMMEQPSWSCWKWSTQLQRSCVNWLICRTRRSAMGQHLWWVATTSSTGVCECFSS